MVNQTENYKTGHTLVLLFTFLFGALMTLLYLPSIKTILPENEGFSGISMMGLLFSASLLISSLNGTVLLPVISILFGCAVAIEVDKIRLLVSIGESQGPDAIRLLLVVPLFFLISNWGMRSSLLIRELMNAQSNVFRKNKFITYTIMLLGLAALATAQSLINI